MITSFFLLPQIYFIFFLRKISLLSFPSEMILTLQVIWKREEGRGRGRGGGLRYCSQIIRGASVLIGMPRERSTATHLNLYLLPSSFKQVRKVSTFFFHPPQFSLPFRWIFSLSLSFLIFFLLRFLRKG